MKSRSITAVLLLSIIAPAVSAQQPTPSPSPAVKECAAETYKSTEVDRKAKILDYPHPYFTERQMERYSGSVIVLRGLLCGSGKVTNLRVVSGVAADIDEEAMRAASRIKFRPAQKAGRNVSQWMQFEYRLTTTYLRP